jgi:hypothetical protein
MTPRLVPSSLLGRFFLAALFWLPLWLVIWYQAAPALSQPVVWLSHWALRWLLPAVIGETLGAGKDLHFATTLTLEVPGAPAGAVGELLVPVNVVAYTWNLPLLLALLQAADQRFFSLERMFIGYLALIPFQAWGVVFAVLKTLSIQAGPAIAAQVGIDGWTREAVALGYQFGFLMLPAIAAGSIWIALNRPLLNALLTEGAPSGDQNGAGAGRR